MYLNYLIVSVLKDLHAIGPEIHQSERNCH